MNKQKKTRMGRLAVKIEKALSVLPFNIPVVVGDLVCGIGSGLSELSGVSQYEGAENRIRGVMLASYFSVTGLKIGRGVILRGKKNIRLGSDVSLADGVYMSATGVLGKIEIGRNTHIDVNSTLYGQGGLTIGNDCAISSGVVIYTQTNQYNAEPLKKIVEQGTSYAPVAIGNDVWIGTGAKVLPGVTIENHAVVGAGAVVTKNVEAWKIVVGVPAHVAKDRRGDIK
jgi:acetyltransferase-like isoleucine patch superfamily enzyme